jgi:hypothetical protein
MAMGRLLPTRIANGRYDESRRRVDRSMRGGGDKTEVTRERGGNRDECRCCGNEFFSCCGWGRSPKFFNGFFGAARTRDGQKWAVRQSTFF